MNSILVREPQKMEHEKISTAGHFPCAIHMSCTIVSGYIKHASSIDVLRNKLTDLSMILYVG